MFMKKSKELRFLSTILMLLMGNILIFTHELNTEQRMTLERAVNVFSARVALEGEANEQNVDSFYQEIERIGINEKDVVAFTYPIGSQDYGDVIAVKAKIKMQPDTVFTYIANLLFHYKGIISVESKNSVIYYHN